MGVREDEHISRFRKPLSVLLSEVHGQAVALDPISVK
jgi:hypothetical protein